MKLTFVLIPNLWAESLGQFCPTAVDIKTDRWWLTPLQRNCIIELLYVRVPLVQQHQRIKALQTRSG